MENVRKHRDTKLVTKEEKRIKLVSYLGMPILDISKTFMYEFWYDYIKPKYGDKEKLCYMDTDSFVIHIFQKDIFEDIANDVERC